MAKKQKLKLDSPPIIFVGKVNEKLVVMKLPRVTPDEYLTWCNHQGVEDCDCLLLTEGEALELVQQLKGYL